MNRAVAMHILEADHHDLCPIKNDTYWKHPLATCDSCELVKRAHGRGHEAGWGRGYYQALQQMRWFLQRRLAEEQPKAPAGTVFIEDALAAIKELEGEE